MSASERAGDDPDLPTGEAYFQTGRRADGLRALFISATPLTDAASGGSDLYLWDGSKQKGDRLTDITTTDPDGAEVIAVVAADAALTRAYFVAFGELTDETVPGTPNLYLWEAGTGVRHVAALTFADEAVWGHQRAAAGARYRDTRVTDDGRFLVFASTSQLTAYPTEGTKQVYLYDAVSGTTRCVSCSPDVEASTAASHLFDLGTLLHAQRAPFALPRNLTADGGTVFFETTQALVKADVNERMDVYRWRGGNIELVPPAATQRTRSSWVRAPTAVTCTSRPSNA